MSQPPLHCTIPMPLSFDLSQHTRSSKLLIPSCNFCEWLSAQMTMIVLSSESWSNQSIWWQGHWSGGRHMWACCILSSYTKSSSADTSSADDECLDKPLVIGYNGLHEVRMNMNFRNQSQGYNSDDSDNYDLWTSDRVRNLLGMDCPPSAVDASEVYEVVVHPDYCRGLDNHSGHQCNQKNWLWFGIRPRWLLDTLQL